MNPPPFSLRQLQYALAVAEARSFRRAAERCHVSQPSLSAQLSLLEEALGTRLFERDKRRVLVTPAGEALLERARRVLAEVEDLTGAARQLGDPLNGTLKIGIIPTVSPYFLPDLVPVLRKRHPRLTVLWSEERTAELLEALRSARLDAVLFASVPGSEDLEQHAVGSDAFVLAGPPDHPLLRRKGPMRLEELEGSPVLLLEEGHCFRDQALALCQRASAPERDFRATSLATLAQMVAGGAGVTLLPHLSLAVENRSGALATRRFVQPTPDRTLVLAWRKHSPLREGLLELGETLRTAYAKGLEKRSGRA